MTSDRSRPGRSGIAVAVVADVPAILVRDESDVRVGVVPVVVPDVVEGVRRGYHLPSGRHQQCKGTAVVGWLRPSEAPAPPRDRMAGAARVRTRLD